MVRYILLIVGWVLLIGCDRGGARSAPDESGASATATPAEGTAASDQPLRLVVIDGAALGEAIERQWHAHAQQPLLRTDLSSAQIATQPLEADVILFPSRWLGQLIEDRQIVPLERGDDADASEDAVDSGSGDDVYEWQDVFGWLRRQELTWNDERYGVSFGSPQLLLCVRQDLLAKIGRDSPQTWDTYLSLCQELQAAIADGSITEVQSATIEPLAEDWAAVTLLARAAAYARHPNQYSSLFQFSTMTPLIDREPFVRALAELQQTVGLHPDSLHATPADCMQRLLRGETAMAFGWPSAAHPSIGNELTPRTWGIHSLPGATEVYLASTQAWEARAGNQPSSVPVLGAAGRIGAIARRARNREAAANFLYWLSRPAQALQLGRASDVVAVSRTSQLQDIGKWMEPEFSNVAGQFAETLLASQQQAAPLHMLRIPGQQEYMDALDLAVRNLLTTGGDPATALGQVAQQWQQITESRGREKQRTAYLQSLGLQVP